MTQTADARPEAPAPPRRAGSAPALLAGLVAGLLGLALANLAAWLVGPAGAPVSAVGEAIIDLLPGPLVNLGKDTLGTADKPVLLVLVAAGVLGLSALAGRLEDRRRGVGLALLGLVAVLGVAGVAARGDGGPRLFLPVLLGTVFAMLLLRTLVGRLHRWRAAGPDRLDVARRDFLRTTVLVGAFAAAGAVVGQALVTARTKVNQARELLRLPTPTVPAPAVPAGADLGVDGLSPYVTPNEDFYRIDTALQVPVVDPAGWSLSVTGMVEEPFTLSWDDVLALPMEEHLATLTCVSNYVGGDLIGNARWLGYPVRALLARARPLAGADMVLSRSVDDFTAGTPLEVLTDPERASLLAVGMNGEPLPLEHGFPARLVVPGLYGYVSATKWVTELKVTTFAQDEGYWTPLGWSALGPVKLSSRIDVPRPGADLDAGAQVVAGVAWAQHTGLSRVEVQVDGGAWQPAELAETAGPDTWRQWRFAWDAPAGEHTLTVRATDAAGVLQVAEQAPPEPDGATGYHRIDVQVR